MERVGDAAFGPDDRIGQLTMRNLDIADSRARLEQYAAAGLVGGATAELVGQLEPGESSEIFDAAEESVATRRSSEQQTSPRRARRSTQEPTSSSRDIEPVQGVSTNTVAQPSGSTLDDVPSRGSAAAHTRTRPCAATSVPPLKP